MGTVKSSLLIKLEVLTMSKYKNLVSITKLIINDHVTFLYDITPIFTDRKQRAEKLHMLTLFENEIFPYLTPEEIEKLVVVMDSHDTERINVFMNQLEVLTAIRQAKKELTL
jgi:hypothetical protein